MRVGGNRVRYIAVGLAFGLTWAAMQVARGEAAEPVALAGAVVLCTLFGALLWGMRSLVLRWRGRSGR